MGPRPSEGDENPGRLDFQRSANGMSVFFLFFFLSGFCSLVYQVVWLRVAMAGFGVTPPLISIVLSIFMAGLALGSWAGGRRDLRTSR